MRPIIATLAVFSLAGALAQATQQATPPPPQTQTKPEAKPETKAPASPAGKWNMAVDTDQGTMASTLDMKVEGKKVTGTIVSQMGKRPSKASSPKASSPSGSRCRAAAAR